MRYGYNEFYNERTGETMTKIGNILALAAATASFGAEAQGQVAGNGAAVYGRYKPAPTDMIALHCQKPRTQVYVGKNSPEILVCDRKEIWIIAADIACTSLRLHVENRERYLATGKKVGENGERYEDTLPEYQKALEDNCQLPATSWNFNPYARGWQIG